MVLLFQVFGTSFNHLLGYCPHFLIHSLSSGLDRHDEQQGICKDMRLIGVEEIILFLHKPSVEPYCIDLLGEVLVLLEFLILLESNCIAVEQRSFLNFKPILIVSFILLGRSLRLTSSLLLSL